MTDVWIAGAATTQFGRPPKGPDGLACEAVARRWSMRD